jgi:chromosomal replication initiation ATPase DnaA
VAQALSRRLTDASYPEIGQYYHQHHSSVIYGVRKAERDQELHNQIDALVLHVKQHSDCELHRIVTSNHESYPPNS